MVIKSSDILNTVIAIPTRLNSTRLPNKPLALINGVPMIVRVVNQALAVSVEGSTPLVVVASGDNEIIDVVNAYYEKTIHKNNIKCVITNPNLQSGTDRINQALDILKLKDKYKFVINLQGDLPQISQEAILNCLEVLLNENFDMSTLVTVIEKAEDYNNPNIVKAVLAGLDSAVDYSKIYKALYFSRSSVPSNIRSGVDNISGVFNHIGIYGFKTNILTKFTQLSVSFLENLEKLEQLRALESNINIGVKIIKQAPLGIDTPEDLIKANLLIK
jgi:3-deoxy-manno-octulosonate cytidylyltransferase (CMP-KDO synthetase)